MEYLEINLTEGTIELLDAGEKHGLALAVELYDRYDGDDAFVLASPTSEAIDISGSAVFSIVYKSPITEKKSFSYSNYPMGYSLLRLNLAAVAIIGKTHRLSYISLYPGQYEIIHSENLLGCSSLEFEREVLRNPLDSVLSTGRAADNGVKFASLQYMQKALLGAGLGYALRSKGIKGIIAQGFSKTKESAESKDSQKWVRKIEKSSFARRVRKLGACCFVDDALRLGWLPVRYYSDRFDPRAYALDAKAFAETYGNYPDTCQNCFIACGRRKKDSTMLPSWQEVMMLGSNLGFFDREKIIALSNAAANEGLDSIYLGALLSYASTLNDKEKEMLGIKDGTLGSYLKLIALIGENRGSGALFQEGLKAFPNAIQTALGDAIICDLRGSYSEAIAASMSLPIVLPAGLLMPKRGMNPECAAILALYEMLYTFALLECGYRPYSAIALYWSKLPAIVFHIPQLMRLFCKGFSLYGKKMKDLLPIGLEIFESLGLELASIPEYFELEPRSALDNKTVPFMKMREYFYREKLNVEISVKSIKEKMDKASSSKSAAVGPDAERGLDAEPGLRM